MSAQAALLLDWPEDKPLRILGGPALTMAQEVDTVLAGEGDLPRYPLWRVNSQM